MKCKDCKYEQVSKHVWVLRERCSKCQAIADLLEEEAIAEYERRERKRKIQERIHKNAYEQAEAELINEGVISQRK